MTLLPGNSSRALANNSISRRHRSLVPLAARTSGSASGTPGLMAMRSTPRSSPGETHRYATRPPEILFATARQTAVRSGCPRLALTRRGWRASAPSTVACAKTEHERVSIRQLDGTRLLHGGLDSRQAHRTDILVIRRTLREASCMGRLGMAQAQCLLNNSNCAYAVWRTTLIPQRFASRSACWREVKDGEL